MISTSPSCVSPKTWRFGPAGLKLPGQRFQKPRFAASVLHIDEIDDDDAAQIAQPDLAGDLGSGLQIHLQNGILQIVRPYKFARIDIDHGQCFSLIDDQIAAVFQPNAPFERFVHLSADIVEHLDLFIIHEPQAAVTALPRA